MRSHSVAVLDLNPGFQKTRLKDNTRLTDAEVARRSRARKKKCAANTGVDFDGPILEMLIKNYLLSRQEAADYSAKGLRKIGEAMYRYLADRARKEIY
jgi:hypothetical protein